MPLRPGAGHISMGAGAGHASTADQLKTPQHLPLRTRYPSTMSEALAYLEKVARHLCVTKPSLAFVSRVVKPPPA